MKEIQLTRDLVALVDDEDYELVSQYEWYALSGHGGPYVVHTVYDVGTYSNIYMHRLIMNAPDDMEVDHVNRNGLDCRRSNMRLATTSQNQANRVAPQGVNGSGYRGVYPTPYGKWRARIVQGGVTHNLGNYDTPEEAAKVWDKAAMQMHGEFAVLNFPP